MRKIMGLLLRTDKETGQEGPRSYSNLVSGLKFLSSLYMLVANGCCLGHNPYSLRGHVFMIMHAHMHMYTRACWVKR